MKLETRRVDSFLRAPGPCRVVLLHGDDLGLMRERAEALVRSVAGSLDDPFRVTELERDAAGRIPDEMAGLALTGGRRVVRLRDVGDSATSAVESALAGPGEALLVLEAAGLTSRSRLRALVEKAPDAMAIGCYQEDGRSLARTIADELERDRISIDPDALEWLATQLGADRALTRAELDKLALSVGIGGHVDLPSALASIGDMAGLSLDDALFAATLGDVAAAGRALDLAMAEGAAPVAILRAALLHLQKLQRAAAIMQGGLSAADAARQIRPPVFFRRVAAFTKALSLWTSESLQAACVTVWNAEQRCKHTGAPDGVLCRQTLLTLALKAQRSSRRPS